MRNLKKILALVLSLAMIMSMTAFAGFADADKVDADYAEAVTVLNGMGVFKGYNDGSFKPQGEISRAEVAAIVYRIATADVDDEYVDLWTGTAKFSDVADAAWYAGYVGFCASNGYVQGYPDGTFKPEAKVTGFEALAMILRVNGYDAEKEFSGIKWSDNIAKVAAQNDILKDVKPGALAKAAPRELVAQLLFGALNAPTVNYTLLNGYTQNKGTLGGEKFDLKKNKNEEADDFGRPAYTWTYKTGNEETVFAAEPLASYTVATKNCDIMADADLDEGDKLDIYYNGEKDGKYEVKDNTTKYGAQGRLVEVYEDRLVVIDTYLAEVTKVKAEKVDSRGHVTPAYVEATVYVNADKDEDEDCIEEMYFETDEFAKGDIVLVTIADGDIASMEIAESKIAELTKVSGNTKKIADIQKIIALDKESVDVNVTADVEPEMTLGGHYEFYYDNYGNVIGAYTLSTNYAVIDSLYSTHIDGDDAAIADIVFFDATMDEDVMVEAIDDEDASDFSERKKENGDYYYSVYTYTTDDDGAYILEDAKFDYARSGHFENGKVYLNTNSQKAEWLQISKSTKILLQYKDSPNGEYEAFVGYSKLPSFYAFEIYYTDSNDDGYVDMLYARAEKFTTRTVFIYDINAVTAETSDLGDYYVAEVEALELVDGKLKEVTFDVAFDDDAADTEITWAIDSIGLYDIREIEENVWGVDYKYAWYGVDKVTTDGKRVYVNDDFFALDDAMIVQYEGSRTEGDYDDEWSFKKLNDESIIFMQFNEDDEVVVVYDIWVKQTVTVDGEKIAANEYFGKNLRTIKVDLEEYEMINTVKMDEDGNTVGLLKSGAKVTYYDADGDEVSMDAVKGTKVDYAEISWNDKVWGDIAITTKAQAAYTNAMLKELYPTNFSKLGQTFSVDNWSEPRTIGAYKYVGSISIDKANGDVHVDDLKAALKREALGTNYQVVLKVMNTETTEATGIIPADAFVLVQAWNGDIVAYNIQFVENAVN